MTIPFERTRALVQTKELLRDLQDPKKTPRIPKALRARAQALERHFPTLMNIEQAHEALPGVYGPVPPFSRMTGSATVTGVLDAASQAGQGSDA